MDGPYNTHTRYFHMRDYLKREHKLSDADFGMPFNSVNGAHHNFYANKQTTSTIQNPTNDAR